MAMSLRPMSFQESSTALEGLGAGFSGFFSCARLETAKETTDKRMKERNFRIMDSVRGNFVARQRYHRKTVVSDQKSVQRNFQEDAFDVSPEPTPLTGHFKTGHVWSAQSSHKGWPRT